LGDAEVARIKQTPRNAVPEFIQRGEDDLEVFALVGVEEPGDVSSRSQRGDRAPMTRARS